MPETDRPGDGAGLTEPTRAALLQWHREYEASGSVPNYCLHDGYEWPCPTVQIVALYDAVTAERDAARERLTEATKAGTPYWHERDAQNALILENQRLTVERDAARERIDRLTATVIETIGNGCPENHAGALSYEDWIARGGAGCPVCLTTERDALRAEVAALRERVGVVEKAATALLDCSFSADEARLSLVMLGGKPLTAELLARCARIDESRRALRQALAAPAGEGES